MRDDPQAVAARIHTDGQVAEVGAADVHRADRLLAAIDPDKGTIFVKTAVVRKHFLLRAGAGQRAVERGEDAAADGNDLRGEGDAHLAAGQQAQFALDLADVLVTGEAIGVHLLVARGVMKLGVELLARAGNAGLAVADGADGLDQAALQGGREAEDAADREAAGIADKARGTEGVAVQFDEAVDVASQQAGGGMDGIAADARGVVPVGLGCREAEIAAVVDQPRAAGQDLRRQGHADAIGGGAEDHVGGHPGLWIIGGQHRQPAESRQVRVDLVDRPPDLLARDQRDEFDPGVLQQQFDDADATVSGGANHFCANHDSGRLLNDDDQP